MGALPFLVSLCLWFGSSWCKVTEYEGYKSDDSSNLTTEDRNQSLFNNLIRTQRFTMGTLLGLVVATLVVVIGSFLVMWRLCCDVEMVVTREVMEPLNSISLKVSSPPLQKQPTSKTLSREKLISPACSSGAIEMV